MRNEFKFMRFCAHLLEHCICELNSNFYMQNIAQIGGEGSSSVVQTIGEYWTRICFESEIRRSVANTGGPSSRTCSYSGSSCFMVFPLTVHFL